MEGIVNVLEVQIHELFAKRLRWETDGWRTGGRPTREIHIVTAICGDGGLAVPGWSVVIAGRACVGEGALDVAISAVDACLARLSHFALSSTVPGRRGQSEKRWREGLAYRHATHAVGGRILSQEFRMGFCCSRRR